MAVVSCHHFLFSFFASFRANYNKTNKSFRNFHRKFTKAISDASTKCLMGSMEFNRMNCVYSTYIYIIASYHIFDFID